MEVRKGVQVKRRLMILAVAHIGYALDNPEIQRLMEKWAVHGDLASGEWAEIEKLATYLGSEQYLNDAWRETGR